MIVRKGIIDKEKVLEVGGKIGRKACYAKQNIFYTCMKLLRNQSSIYKKRTLNT